MRNACAEALRIPSLAVACVLLIVACASQPKAPDGGNIVLKRADGQSVEVPLSGSLHDPRAERLAREIQVLDEQIATAQGKIIGTTGPPTGREAVQYAMLDIAIESREDALRELELALAVAPKTSAGSLDNETVARAEENASSASAVLSTQPPNSILVATNISTSVPGASLHYMSKGKHRQHSSEWSSYSDGERLRIGRYVFRVQPADPGTEIYEETVLVVSNPTQKRLTPLRRPNP